MDQHAVHTVTDKLTGKWVRVVADVCNVIWSEEVFARIRCTYSDGRTADSGPIEYPALSGGLRPPTSLDSSAKHEAQSRLLAWIEAEKREAAEKREKSAFHYLGRSLKRVPRMGA